MNAIYFSYVNILKPYNNGAQFYMPLSIFKERRIKKPTWHRLEFLLKLYGTKIGSDNNKKVAVAIYGLFFKKLEKKT